MIMEGKNISKIFYEELRCFLKNQNKHPHIVDISIGNDFASLKYAKLKKKILSLETNINFESVYFEKITSKELIKYIQKLNQDLSVDGIMIQLPLPDNLIEDERLILDTIKKEKDIDGLTSTSLGLLDCSNKGFIPCTALGIDTLLKSYNISLEGSLIGIINRSNIVGKPLAKLLLRDNATVIMCHSKTRNLKDITKMCDIVIVGVNKANFINSTYIKEGAIIIDIGVHKTKEEKTVGDVNFYDVLNKASLITPAINGVGPMTICMLAYNSYKTIYNDIDKVLENTLNKIRNNLIHKK